jgi:hypothetical protein
MNLRHSFSAESYLKCLVLARSLRTAVLVKVVKIVDVCVWVVTAFVPIQSMMYVIHGEYSNQWSVDRTFLPLPADTPHRLQNFKFSNTT